MQTNVGIEDLSLWEADEGFSCIDTYVTGMAGEPPILEVRGKHATAIDINAFSDRSQNVSCDHRLEEIPLYWFGSWENFLIKHAV